LIYPTVGIAPLMKSFCVAILGGMRSIKGAIFSGYILGLTEALSVVFFGSLWKDVFAFVVIMVVLIFRPFGLFGVTVKR